jgi:hypothetical protein
MSDLAADIRAALAQYLAGEIPLAAFDKWFTPATWNVERRTDPQAQALADEIDLRLAEYTNGHWTEAELRTKLADLQPDWIEARSPIRSDSVAEVITVPVIFQALDPLRVDQMSLSRPLVDTQFVTASW